MQEPSAARIEQLKAKLHQDPTSMVFLQLTEELRRAGKLEEALATCRQGLEKNPCYHSARASLGRLYLDLGRFEEAQLELERVLTEVPDNLLAKKMLQNLQAGSSKKPAKRASAKSPDRPVHDLPPVAVSPGKAPTRTEPATETLAGVYLQQGHREEAIRVYRRILVAEPGNHSVREKLETLETGPVAEPPPVAAPSNGGGPLTHPNRKKISALQSWLDRIHRE
ncbi:MAG: tetratricopeptide repeat protein [Acidobacteriota bacterium]